MTNSERAWQAWPALGLAARNRQLVTYEMLSKLTGMHAAGFGDILEHIQSYCILKRLPPLSVIVVNKGTGLPGAGFVAATDIPHAFAQVFEHDWSTVACPTPEQLSEAVRLHPSNGAASALPTTP
jgi:putative restriction endonuclease